VRRLRRADGAPGAQVLALRRCVGHGLGGTGRSDNLAPRAHGSGARDASRQASWNRAPRQPTGACGTPAGGDLTMPFNASHLDEVPGLTDGRAQRLYDVELPYRRLGRCRTSDAVAAVLGTEAADVAVALSTYEARNGRQRTAAELLGPGVDLGAEDAAVVAYPAGP
jgi:hypothetical protein